VLLKGAVNFACPWALFTFLSARPRASAVLKLSHAFFSESVFEFLQNSLAASHYIQSVVDDTCQNYTQHMSKPGTLV